MLFLSLVSALAACQNTQVTSQKNVGKTLSNSATSVSSVLTPARKSVDGVQDVTWKIMRVENKPIQVFNQMPYLIFNSNFKTLQGSTGCNPIYGHYQYAFSSQIIRFDAKAGHASCDGALAQEAELVDAFQRVKGFKIQGRELLLVDQAGQTLIQAQQR